MTAKATKADLQNWILDALHSLNGEAHLTKIAQYIWDNHESELRASGDLFFTWQYDMRWAGQALQQAGKMKKLAKSWALTK
ncbi:MAG: hypothetical protein K9G71_02135 [Rhodobacteraceae bacterium]|nr:hypothetical protein [Paracoccaceae bacterium]MCF8513129.1 hypothetical protein [Paracoccaceae bacterium]MCF8517373.1 hypothetical protein [Paracoccaceae bacterium]